MEKADEIERLRTELEVEKEQRINEERRLYYVAITRARDLLYLCHAEGTVPSEFIRIIGDELKTDHVMLTQEEERECQRLAVALHEATAKNKVDDEKVQEHTEILLSQSKFKAISGSVQLSLGRYIKLSITFTRRPGLIMRRLSGCCLSRN